MRNEVIAERLTKLRGSTPREEVAKKIGISVSALQMYENGHRIPRDDIKLKLSEYYNKSVQEIFFDPEPHVLCGGENSPAHDAETA